MGERPLSSEVKDALAACDNLRCMLPSVGLVVEEAEKEITHVETLLRHLLNILIEKVKP